MVRAVVGVVSDDDRAWREMASGRESCASEIVRHADGLADMFCAYLGELARR